MNHTELMMLFREHMKEGSEFLPIHPGPPELGGPKQQHLSSHFKLDTPDAFNIWAPRAMKMLAESVSHSFPGPYQFYRLDDPLFDCYWTTIEDPEICIRQFNRNMFEEWTEPGPGATKETFKPRKRWDDHTRVTFEIIFQFGVE